MTWCKHHWVTIATWISVFAGVLLRLRQYLIGRSLWLDEALLALNILQRTFLQLTQPLDYSQGAPLLFLWTEKLLTELIGNGENVLRLLPFLSGLFALFLFPLIASKYQSPRAALWGTILFAFADPLIWYASEIKQYSGDVLATLLALALFLTLVQKRLRTSDAILLAMAGVLLIWASHSAIFTLVSAALIAFLVRFHQGDRQQLFVVLAVGAIWSGGFLMSLIFSLDNLAGNQILLNFWKIGFPPQTGGALAFLEWFQQRFLDLFVETLDITLVAVAIILYLVGIVVMARRNGPFALSLVLPVVFVLAAAVLNRYPFFGRLLIFLFPLILILIAEGLDRLLIWPEDRRYLQVAGSLILLVFLAPQVVEGLSYVSSPKYREDIAPAIQYVYENKLPNDPVYIYYSSRIPFFYYKERYPIADDSVILGVYSRDDWEAYGREMEELAQKHTRLWLIFSHVHTGGGGNEEEIILNSLTELGAQEQESIILEGASAHLYTIPP